MRGFEWRPAGAGRGRARAIARTVALAIVPVITVSEARAAVIYERYTELWSIIGDTGNASFGPTCRLAQDYRDGSYFGLYRHLQTGELFILLSNAAWNIRGRQGDQLDVTYHFYTPRTVYDSLLGYTYLIDANTIAIPNINPDTFINPFYYSTYLEIIMPGTIPPVTVSLIGTAEGLVILDDCVASTTGAPRTQAAPQAQPLEPRPRN